MKSASWSALHVKQVAVLLLQSALVVIESGASDRDQQIFLHCQTADAITLFAYIGSELANEPGR